MKNAICQAMMHCLKPRHSSSSKDKRFLILSTTGLGDTLWGTPAIKALREQYPTSYIGVVTSPIGKEILLHNRRIDELFVVSDPATYSLFSLYRRLKAKQITHVLLFHTSQRPLLPLAASLGAETIIGSKGSTKGLDHLMTHALDHQGIHEIERRLQIVAHVGAHCQDPVLELPLSPEDEKQAEVLIPPHVPLVALHPGAKDRFKQWPASHFIELGRRLIQHLGCALFITGNASEKELVQLIASHIPGSHPITELPLRATAALIKRMQLMVTNDTGPMHIAFAMRTPTVALFTPTDPKLCGPYFVSATSVIAKKPTCTPCLRKKCQEPFCLLQIGVQEVYDAAINLLEMAIR